MAIHFSIKPCAAQQRTKNRSAAERGTSLGEKAAELLTLAVLRRRVDDLQDEVLLQMCAIGELVYATHRGNPSDSDELQQILEYVDDLHDEIDGHEQQIKLMRGIYPCPICGSDVTDSDVFCKECGQPLPTPHQF